MSWIKITNLKTGKVYDSRNPSKYQSRERLIVDGKKAYGDPQSDYEDTDRYIEGEYDHEQFMAVRNDRTNGT